MKKHLRTILTVTIAALFMTAFGCDNLEKSTSEEFLSFTLSENGSSYEVSASNMTMPETVVIPSSYNGKIVVGVADNGFTAQNCTNIRSLVIKGYKMEIGKNAFRGLPNLKEVIIKSKNECIIDDYAFFNCGNLTRIEFVTNANCLIGDYSFCETAIENLDLGLGVSEIGVAAFYGLDELKSIEIPASVTVIKERAFTKCPSLAEIKVSNENERFSAVLGDLYNKDGSILIQYATGKTEISTTVTADEIKPYAFAYSSTLSSVTLSESVEKVGNFSFIGCKNLDTTSIFADCVTDNFGEYWNYID